MDYEAELAELEAEGVQNGIEEEKKERKKALLKMNHVLEQIQSNYSFETVTSSKSYSLDTNSTLRITASSAITLTLKNSDIIGLAVLIINASSALTHSLSTTNVDGSTVDLILPNSVTKIIWNGSAWVNITAPAVGSTFTQYPQQKTPDEVYPCTKWSELSYNGAFFRAGGGNASSFISENGTLTAQSQATAKNGLALTKSGKAYGNSQTITTGEMSGNNYVDLNSQWNGYNGWAPVNVGRLSTLNAYKGKIDSGSSGSSGYVSGRVNLSHTHSSTFTPSVSDNISYSISGDTETRPTNYTIKIWKRIA